MTPKGLHVIYCGVQAFLGVTFFGCTGVPLSHKNHEGDVEDVSILFSMLPSPVVVLMARCDDIKDSSTTSPERMAPIRRSPRPSAMSINTKIVLGLVGFRGVLALIAGAAPRFWSDFHRKGYDAMNGRDHRLTPLFPLLMVFLGLPIPAVAQTIGS